MRSPAQPASEAVAALSRVPARSTARGRWADYYELTKPRLNFLVVITAMVGYYMAAGASMGAHGWLLLLHTLIGTALTAAGSGALNQYAERAYDARMPRTLDRPLPAGRLTPGEALRFALILSTAGVVYLATMVNGLTAGLGLFTLLSYILLYTPLKRRSTLNTIVGAVPGAIPPMMGMAAFDGRLSPQALALFTIMFLWQTPHFLAIAILYRNDYAAAGFKMLPVVDRELHTTSRQIVTYTAALIPASLMPVMLNMAGTGYLLAASTLGTGFLVFALACAARKQRPEARRLFLASIIYLPLLFAAMMVNRL